MLPIKKELLTNKTNRPYLRDQVKYSIRELKGIVAHWTANTKAGADAHANRNYFNGSAMYASAHYCVDDGEIIQCIPDNEVGYHVGANNYRPDGEKIMGKSGLSPNYFLVGFEMCVNSDGNWEKTYKNSVKLAAHLLLKYQFSLDDLYRHHDITGKDCPKMMLTAASWGQFKKDIEKEMANDLGWPIKSAKVVDADTLNIRSGAGAAFSLLGKLNKGDAVEIFEEKSGWSSIGKGRWVSSKYLRITSTTQFGIINDPTGANVRSGAGGNFAIVDALPVGVMVAILETNDRWLRVGSEMWVSASLVNILETQSGKVVGTDSLNARSGAGTNFPIVKKLLKDEEVTVFETSGSWLQVGKNQWVFKSFIQLD